MCFLMSQGLYVTNIYMSVCPKDFKTLRLKRATEPIHAELTASWISEQSERYPFT